MYLQISGTDLSHNVQREAGYNVNSEPVYDEWENANRTLKRNYVRTRVTGSIDLAFISGGTTTALDDFLALLEGATSENVLTATVFVQNENDEREIQCFYRLSGNKHIVAQSGYAVDLLTLSIEEV